MRGEGSARRRGPWGHSQTQKEPGQEEPPDVCAPHIPCTLASPENARAHLSPFTCSACFLPLLLPLSSLLTVLFIFPGQTPVTKLSCLSLPLLREVFPDQTFCKQYPQCLQVRPLTRASWPLFSLPGTYSVFHNGTVLHALFPFIQMGSNYHKPHFTDE